MQQSQSTTVSRCSLVVRTTDVWTGRPAAPSSVRVRLQNIRTAPLRTSEGSWAFLDVNDSECEIIVESNTYLPISQRVDLASLDPGHPVVELFLLPNRLYAPPPSATGIVRRLKDGRGKPLANVEVFAYADDDGGARGRIIDAEVPSGSRELRCLPGATALISGDALALRGKDGSAAEWFRVQPRQDEDEVLLRLDRPTAGDWKRHALLLPAAATVSDVDGWVVLPFRGRVSAAGGVRVKLRDGEQMIAEQWPLEQGRTVVLPDFVWP